MADVYGIQLKENTNEEILPGYSDDFPYICSRAFVDKYSVPWHWHRAVELFWVEKGSLELETPQGCTLFTAGSGGLVNSDVLHMTRTCGQNEPTVQRIHLFDATLISGAPDSRIAKKYVTPITGRADIELLPLMQDVPEHAKALELIKNSFDMDSDAFEYEIKLRSVLSEIWLELIKAVPQYEHKAIGSSAKVKQMMVFVYEHYAERISVPDIAAAGFVSERECYRAFKTFLHTTPLEYLNGFRLQTARRMLAGTKESITNICLSCGFNDSSFFGKVFRAEYGMTPSQYRASWQNITKE